MIDHWLVAGICRSQKTSHVYPLPLLKPTKYLAPAYDIFPGTSTRDNLNTTNHVVDVVAEVPLVQEDTHTADLEVMMCMLCMARLCQEWLIAVLLTCRAYKRRVEFRFQAIHAMALQMIRTSWNSAVNMHLFSHETEARHARSLGMQVSLSYRASSCQTCSCCFPFPVMPLQLRVEGFKWHCYVTPDAHGIMQRNQPWKRHPITPTLTHGNLHQMSQVLINRTGMKQECQHGHIKRRKLGSKQQQHMAQASLTGNTQVQICISERSCSSILNTFASASVCNSLYLWVCLDSKVLVVYVFFCLCPETSLHVGSTSLFYIFGLCVHNQAQTLHTFPIQYVCMQGLCKLHMILCFWFAGVGCPISISWQQFTTTSPLVMATCVMAWCHGSSQVPAVLRSKACTT